MDWLQRLGGRKFLMALVAMAVGAVTERYTEKGLSMNLVTLLLGLVGAFSASNLAATSAFLRSRGSGKNQDLDGINEKLDALMDLAKLGTDQQSVQQLINLLQNLNAGIADVKSTTAQVGLAVANTQKMLKG